MVGRFVEQQQIGLRDERAREEHAAPPAAGERVDAGVGGQIEPRKHRLHALLEAPAVPLFEFVLQPPELGECELRASLGDLDRCVVVVRHDRAEIAQAFRHDVEHRPIGRERNVLHQSGDAQIGLAPDGAGVRLHVAADDLQQRRLARAVASDDTDALARLNLKARIIEQREMAVGHRDVVERNKRHGLARGVLADGVEEDAAEVVGFSRADAFHFEQRRQGVGSQPCHFAQGCIVKDDVRRNPARARDLQPHRAQAFEEIAVHVLPRLGLDSRLSDEARPCGEDAAGRALRPATLSGSFSRRRPFCVSTTTG